MSARTRKNRTAEDVEKFGFRWGPLDVIRVAEFPNGMHAVEVATDFGAVSVYVSKTGRSIRVFKGDVELKAPAERGTP